MRLYELKLFITSHALEQFQARVEPISRNELEDRVQAQIESRDYRRSGDFIHIAGVWFVVEYTEKELRLVTCYGRTNFDIPAALEWAKVHKDRLVLPNAK